MSVPGGDREGDGSGRIRYNAIDPTRTLTLRDSFQSEHSRRWRDARGRNRDWLSNLSKPFDPTRLQSRYRDFFTGVAQNLVLDPMSDRVVKRGDHWTGEYIRQAYQKGLELARRDLNRFDAPDEAVTQPTDQSASFHQDRLRAEYVSAYYEVEGHTEFARAKVMKSLKTGLRKDKSKTWLIDETNAIIRNKVSTQYNADANTAVVTAVNQALLTSFENANVSEVGVAIESDLDVSTNTVGEMRTNAAGELEFRTAGDDKVCPVCEGLAGERVKIANVRGKPKFLPPVHPNCRCRLVPVAMQVGGKTVTVPSSFSGGLRGSSS